MSQQPTRAQRRRKVREWRNNPVHHPDLQSNVATDIGLWSYIGRLAAADPEFAPFLLLIGTLFCLLACGALFFGVDAIRQIITWISF